MDIRCEKCAVEYEFDAAKVPDEGLSVECGNCAHRFRVTLDDGIKGWLLKYVDGTIEHLDELATLQRRIVEQKVSPAVRISRTGKQWTPIGDIAELSSFFMLAATASQHEHFASTGEDPSWEMGKSLVNEDREPEIGDDLNISDDALHIAHYRRRSRNLTVVVGLLGLVVILGAAVVGLRTDFSSLHGIAGNFSNLFSEEEESPEAKAPETAVAAPAAPALRQSSRIKSAKELQAEAKAKRAQLLARARAIRDKRKPPGGTNSAQASPAPSSAPTPAPAAKPASARPVRSMAQLMRNAIRARERDRPTVALIYYEKALAKDENHLEAMAGAAWCFLDLRRFDESVRMFNRVLAQHPEHADAYIGLAELQRLQGNNAEAKVHYRNYLRVAPNGPEAGVANNMLRQLE